MMEDEVVRRRAWLSHQEFLDLMAATNLIPGPNSTEMAIHIGYRRAGVAGLVAAGASFILPATLIVGILAWAYVRYGSLPVAAGLLYGVKPVVIAIVAQALWRLGRTAVQGIGLAAIGVIAAAAQWSGVHELIVLLAAALAAAVGEALVDRSRGPAGSHPLVFLPFKLGVGSAGLATGAVVGGAATVGLAPLFAVFMKIGAVLFGSGYVLLAFLRADLVERRGWLTETQLLDAVSVGQVTPGPLFTTATFIGYVLRGPAGALLATLGIFLPAFIFVAASAPFVPRLRESKVAGRMLDGLNVASLALMAVVSVRLGHAAVVDMPTAVIAVCAAILLLRFRINSSWLVLGGAMAGVLLKAV
jgi:chromate transporter